MYMAKKIVLDRAINPSHAFENLILFFVKEVVKVNKYRKFGDLFLKAVALLKLFFKQKLNREYIGILPCPSSLGLKQILIHSLFKFWCIFCFKKTQQCRIFQYLTPIKTSVYTNFDRLFPFLSYKSANMKFIRRLN